MKITAALEDGSGKFVIGELEQEPPRADEVLVKIAACGICHTDMAMRGENYLLGHEASGTVAAAGEKVAGFRPGDKVVMSYASCGRCGACKKGRPYACRLFFTFWDGKREDGTTPLSDPATGRAVYPLLFQGGFSTQAVCLPRALTRVDTPLALEFLGPLGCGVITGAGSVMHCLKPERGKALAVFGTGAVGLSAVLAAGICGCDPLIAVDRIPSRLELAREFGATHCINSAENGDPAEAIRSVCGGIDYGFDTSGDHALLESFRAVLKPAGRACGVGIGGSIVLSAEERGEGKSWESPTDGWSVPREFIPRLLALQQRGAFPFEKMIRFYPFTRINQAFEDAASGRTIKAVLVME